MRKIKIKDKRGFLLAEETLKIIISVIAISFLIYFLSSLYLTNSQQQKKSQASASLERINAVVENLGNSEENVSAINPSGWFIYSFVNEKFPNSCAGKNCLCICDNSFLGIKNQAKKCSEDGVCEIVENLEKFDPIKISAGGKTSIIIEKNPNKIVIDELK